VTKTLSPILWSLLNEVPPHHLQKPHRHTTIAIDLVTDGEDAATLLGQSIDEQGSIIEAQSVRWQPGMAFTTPSWLWHAHKNDGDKPAMVFPVQDAGLLAWQRLYRIEFASEVEIIVLRAGHARVRL